MIGDFEDQSRLRRVLAGAPGAVSDFFVELESGDSGNEGASLQTVPAGIDL